MEASSNIHELKKSYKKPTVVQRDLIPTVQKITPTIPNETTTPTERTKGNFYSSLRFCCELLMEKTKTIPFL